MPYTKIKNDIAALSQKAREIEQKAEHFNRPMTAKEAGLVAEIEDQIDDLRMQLPVGGPLSLSGPRSSASTSTGAFKSFGEQIQAVIQAGLPGGKTDPRLFQAAASGLNEGTPSEGGFLVQQDFSTQLLGGVFDVGLVASRCNRIPISSGANGIKLPAIDETFRVNGSRWGGVQTYWKAEADQATASKPKFRTMELSLNKLFGLAYVTDELMADSAAMERVLGQAFTEEMAFKLDDAVINGNGAGQPLGIMNSPALVSVAAEGGQKTDTVVFENIVKMYARMPGRNRKNAVWFVNQDVETQLFTMSLAVGTGGIPVYMPAGGASGSPFSTLFGRPVIPIEQCATLGDLGDILFVDPSAYILIDKGGIEPASSIHLRFDYDEMALRWIYRVDGQPALASPITPFKGSNELSPFVALAAR